MAQKRQNILISILFLSPLILQLSKLFASTTTLFIIGSVLALGLLVGIFINDITSLDQWFLERAISWTSIPLELINILTLFQLLPRASSAFMFEIAIACYALSLFFVERHFTIKNVLVIILNLNVLANYMTPAGDILVLAISVLALIFYLGRVLITHTEQLNLAILIVYLITMLVGLIWLVPQLPIFDTDSFAWRFEACSLFLVLPIAYLLLINKEKIEFNTHVLFASFAYILISETALIVAEPNIFNIVLVVIFFLFYLCSLNFFGNIELADSSKKISVIIPVFNNAQTIVEALESIKKQTYREWEVIIIDTGSNDGTETIVKRYLRYNELPVTYLKQKKHSQLEAIKDCLDYVDGDICYILEPTDVLFDSNVFYRATSALCGEKCDGVFVGVQKIDQHSKPQGTMHLRSYYDSQTTVARLALLLGKNPYTNWIYWRKDIFVTSIKENYLTNNFPAWYDASKNIGLKVANTNFIGLKHRNSIANKEIDYNRVAGELRAFHHILSKLTIPVFRSQSAFYRVISKLRLSSIWPVLFWQGKTPLRNINPKPIKYLEKRLKSPYFNVIANFIENYNSDKSASVDIPTSLKIFTGTEVAYYNRLIQTESIDNFYWEFMKIIDAGTSRLVVRKKDKKKLESILEFFTIKDYVQVITRD